ncbi:uncharacterized protein BO80DRAFT_249912 [Aspergillus ibericus CBS 121593]|uniref:Uncharacterized protein n=1 Tax=Aspergillus ibericus CBS 121593 TaxID=1448316 RepID=A0A395GL72_9EURO|nr:hypothetical protein BO80DRAFT_249912 [Aspergillus ibericus CBS 121593]RAK95728.1 hypothetical protein BO80DRAFT_249912 [Aspergillus ibericus CBS 121593]
MPAPTHRDPCAPSAPLPTPPLLGYSPLASARHWTTTAILRPETRQVAFLRSRSEPIKLSHQTLGTVRLQASRSLISSRAESAPRGPASPLVGSRSCTNRHAARTIFPLAVSVGCDHDIFRILCPRFLLSLPVVVIRVDSAPFDLSPDSLQGTSMQA